MQSSHIPESQPLGSALQLMSQGSYSDGKWNWQKSQPRSWSWPVRACLLPGVQPQLPAVLSETSLLALPSPHIPHHVFLYFFFFKEHLAPHSYFPLCLPVYFLSLHEDLRTERLSCLRHLEPLLGTEANTVRDSINMCRSENDRKPWLEGFRRIFPPFRG